jgi:hypothetical protein
MLTLIFTTLLRLLRAMLVAFLEELSDLDDRPALSVFGVSDSPTMIDSSGMVTFDASEAVGRF